MITFTDDWFVDDFIASSGVVDFGGHVGTINNDFTLLSPVVCSGLAGSAFNIGNDFLASGIGNGQYLELLSSTPWFLDVGNQGLAYNVNVSYSNAGSPPIFLEDNDELIFEDGLLATLEEEGGATIWAYNSVDGSNNYNWNFATILDGLQYLYIKGIGDVLQDSIPLIVYNDYSADFAIRPLYVGGAGLVDDALPINNLLYLFIGDPNALFLTMPLYCKTIEGETNSFTTLYVMGADIESAIMPLSIPNIPISVLLESGSFIYLEDGSILLLEGGHSDQWITDTKNKLMSLYTHGF